MISEIERKTIFVPDDVIPCRIDLYLVQNGVGLSRSQIQKLILEGKISVVGKGIKSNFIIKGGEQIEIAIEGSIPTPLIAEDIPIDVVFEDEHLIVVDKPSGMVTHPARGNFDGTLLNAVLHHTGEISNIGGDYRPGIVHRLDKDTTGLIILAKRAQVHLKLSAMLSRREIHRRYLALLWWHLPESIMTVDAPLGRNKSFPTKRGVDKNGQSAKTEFRVVQSFGFTDLAIAKLFTGRTHQIRVHAQHIGHPVFGDSDYGGDEARLGCIPPQFRQSAQEALELTTRQLLHAFNLSFVHPVTDKLIDLYSPLPNDFIEVLKNISQKDFRSIDYRSM
jgi:23S rRNA pseudouridine1911/1915/1917 synthase